jgi:SNF family Na+-dependent transporter
LAAMLITMPFLSLLSKSAKEWLEILGFFGAIGNCVVVIELAYRIIAEIIYYSTQKPQMYFDHKRNTMAQRYELFDTFPVKYFFVFLLITVSTWIVMDIYSTKKKFGRAGKKYSGKNPLNLNE